MSIIDPKTGCTLHPDVQVGSQLTWRELSEGGSSELYDPRFHRPDHPQLVVRHGEVIEIVEDDYEDWLLVKFTGVDGVVYETDIPGEWWDQVHLIEAE